METTYKKQSKAAKIIAWTVFTPIIVAFFCFFALQAFAPQTSIRLFGAGFFLVANTGSMEPKLTHNDLIVVTRASFDELDVGDTVTFRTLARVNGRPEYIYITHNITGYRTNPETGAREFHTRWLNSRGYDRRVMTIDGADGTNMFVGQMATHNRTFGRIFAYMQAPHGMAAIMLNIILFTMILYFLQPAKVPVPLGKRLDPMPERAKDDEPEMPKMPKPSNPKSRESMQKQMREIFQVPIDRFEIHGGEDG